MCCGIFICVYSYSPLAGGGIRVSGCNHIKLHSHIAMPEKWSEEDDIKLWSLRSKPVPQLSTTFNKTSGAIRSRLIHLQDPTHKAYQRRVKNGDSDRNRIART